MENQNQFQKSELKPNWVYRGRGFATILRMGHCAPAVMQTILDVSATEQEWLVKLSAGMPGGIGNTGFECGAVTSPLVLLGIRYGLGEVERDLPVIFDKGRALCHNFLAYHKTLNCREIRGKDRFPIHCIPPVACSTELYLAACDGNPQDAIPATRRAGYSRLYSYFCENNFHCAQAVLSQLGYTPTENRELFDAVSAFMGGTLFMGKTCSAFTAGVMAVGLRAGEIENNILRVTRMLAIMTAGGYAFDERLNKFNRSMNRGYRLSKWFAKEFGSTQCQAITQCDFSDPSGVSNYIEGDLITKCRTIAGKVAEQVQMMLAEPESQAI
jgi:C_GCAxxG_C_C family probable redox protein